MRQRSLAKASGRFSFSTAGAASGTTNKMSIKITKAEFETLPDSLKAKFTASGEDYILQEEDVEGLKKSKAEILQEKKELQVKLDEAEKFRKEHEAKVAEADEAKLKEEGAFKELEKKLRDKITEIEAAAAEKEAGFLSSLKNERLQNFLVEKGVIAAQADLAVMATADKFDLVNEGGKFTLKLKDGIGDAGELDKAVEELKTARPVLFTAIGASGGGALGSQNNGGGQKRSITRAEHDANPVAYAGQLAKGEITITD